MRALVLGFLVPAAQSYRTRARAVASRLDSAFFDPGTAMYRASDGGPLDVVMTPELFGWLQSALRETHKVLHVPGDPVLDRKVLEKRIARMNKLDLNGWDDLDGDQHVDAPGECLEGRLQMAEQLLTGELGLAPDGTPTADRDGDCVPELAHEKIGSLLARQVRFHE